jgi:hypothetical protein
MSGSSETRLRVSEKGLVSTDAGRDGGGVTSDRRRWSKVMRGEVVQMGNEGSGEEVDEE